MKLSPTLLGSSLFTLAAASLLTSSMALAEARTYKIGAAVYGLKGQFMQNWVRELKQHPAVKDGTVQITVFDGNYDALTQNNQIETMVTQHYDAIIFVPIDTKAGVGAVARAQENDIPVIASNTKVASASVPYVGNDDVEGGRLQALAMVDKLKGQGNVVIIQGPIGQSAQIDREKGEMEVLKQHPQIKVIEMKTANWSRAEALSLTEDWLNAHPNGGISGIIAQNDDMALGALQAVKSRGLSPAQVPVTSIDGMPDAIQAAKKGDITTFLQDAQAQSQGALDVALRTLAGKDYKPQSVIWQRYAKDLQWGDGSAKLYILPWVPVTADNADALYQQVAGSK
ncbi:MULTISPECIES: substrate-binding domain-containing protein [Pseudomonas]|jgi:putative xylitol transport system substrate-binding protein|uniref:substrate-binding domain-containing protein n=1 Tax=Pseudomonas TaxID=286 RepID=UPI0008772541|nr:MULTISPECIES: substrate-binding domain-containing protein [Pseudomonas]UVM08736.1 substrate-binding domain-containing protein [Pseudomonas protegens]SCZ75678.1 putative xylitol transport system substrate-binding protein [Pseudomonas sp. NFPP17]SDA38894.1 putative xylitol transport system substrate-binding protein [Pseudomonas sp. NFPP15]SEK49803.1 putative xylitol transport system substrate-binding protein [Pseudomonas sp. NFPP18]SFA68463.1 putative xylitol transport system substrate-bindin